MLWPGLCNTGPGRRETVVYVCLNSPTKLRCKNKNVFILGVYCFHGCRIFELLHTSFLPWVLSSLQSPLTVHQLTTWPLQPTFIIKVSLFLEKNKLPPQDWCRCRLPQQANSHPQSPYCPHPPQSATSSRLHGSVGGGRSTGQEGRRCSALGAQWSEVWRKVNLPEIRLTH